MAAKVPVQTHSFTSGLLDPEMKGRLDLKAYYSGCALLTNMLPRQLGGQDRRPGTAFVAEITAAANGCRLACFEKSSELRYLLVFLDAAVKIYFEDALVATVTLPYTAAQLSGLDWDQELDTMLLVHNDVKYRKLVRQGSHADWAVSELAPTNIPTYDFGSGAEAIWSTARGWPGAVCLHQGRLYFGRPKSRINRVDGSMSEPGKLFDFGTTVDGKADEAVSCEMLGGGVNEVRGIFGTDDLFILSTAGTGVVPTSDGAPAPDNFVPQKYGAIPAAQTRPRVVNDHVVFLSEAIDDNATLMHASLFEMAWNNDAQTYYAQDLATRCPSLMRSPVDFSVRDTGQKDAAPNAFVVNTDDGSMAVLTPNRFENVTAWAEWVTDGEFLRTETVGTTVYLVVKRMIDGVARYYLERIDPTRWLDCSLKLTNATPQTTWTGLDHLEGKEVCILADGHLMPRATVTGGAVTIPDPALSVEIGLPFSWKLAPMPIEAQLEDGTLVGHKFRTPEIAIRVKDTAELWVNGVRQTFRRLDASLLDQALPVYSGVHKMRQLGWHQGGDTVVTLEGHDPLPATILSISITVAQ